MRKFLSFLNALRSFIMNIATCRRKPECRCYLDITTTAVEILMTNQVQIRYFNTIRTVEQVVGVEENQTCRYS